MSVLKDRRIAQEHPSLNYSCLPQIPVYDRYPAFGATVFIHFPPSRSSVGITRNDTVLTTRVTVTQGTDEKLIVESLGEKGAKVEVGGKQIKIKPGDEHQSNIARVLADERRVIRVQRPPALQEILIL